MNQWELGDFFKIVMDWVAARQQEGKLSKEWGSVQSFNGDKLITLHQNGMRIGPYIIIYDTRQPPPRYEAHQMMHARMGWFEVLGHCDAADPLFFEKLLKDMIAIQTATALSNLNDEHKC